jgi:hypothetical protein
VKVGVWYAVSARRIVVPVFFNETINYERYVQVILGKFFPELQKKKDYGWFEQDSATARTARLYLYAGFVRCLREQNYQQWYLTSTFTRS